VQWADWKTNYQALYDAVRTVAPKNIVIIGGIDWAYDLSQVISKTSVITGTNIVYTLTPMATRRPALDLGCQVREPCRHLPAFRH